MAHSEVYETATVMVWDDDRIARDLTARKVMELGYGLWLPDSDTNAYRAFERRQCDAVVLVLRPQGGILVPRRVRELRRLNVYAPIFILASPLCCPKQLASTFSEGATAWLSSPTNHSSLDRALRAGLKQARLHHGENATPAKRPALPKTLAA